MEDDRAKREASFAQAAAGLDEKARSMLHDMLFNDPFYYGDIDGAAKTAWIWYWRARAAKATGAI